MQKNVGTVDRIARAVVGVLFLLLANTVMTEWRMWLMWAFGFILLVTAALGYCHVYTLFGFSTIKKSNPAEPLHEQQ